MYKYNPSKQPHHYYKQKVFKEGGRAQYLIISFGTSCPIFEGVPLISLDLNWSCNFSSKLIFQIGAQSIFFFCHWLCPLVPAPAALIHTIQDTYYNYQFMCKRAYLLWTKSQAVFGQNNQVVRPFLSSSSAPIISFRELIKYS